MTPSDAALLLIAVAGSSMVKDTIDVVRDFSALEAFESAREMNRVRGAPTSWSLKQFDVPAIKSLKRGHTFLDFMRALIGSAEDGSLESAIKQHKIEIRPGKFMASGVRIAVSLFGPTPEALVLMSRAGGFNENILYSSTPDDNELSAVKTGEEIWFEAKEDFEIVGTCGDLIQERRFTLKTIVAVGNLIRKT
jgi:hypothetical protein